MSDIDEVWLLVAMVAWFVVLIGPDQVARWCDWPANHADLMARKRRLNLETETLLERLCADEKAYDAPLAGYYIWAASCWIGSGLICPQQMLAVRRQWVC